MVRFYSVPDTLQFLIRHGYLILFAVVFVEQAGLPVASVPVLLGIGALSVNGGFSFAAALLITLAACLPADIAWYQLGRRRGYKVLRVLCKISIEPDTCVERTTGSFTRYGMGTLIIAKFVPGLGAVATPMAGLLNMRLGRFLLLDAMGATLWGGLYLTLGVIFRSQLERIAAIVARTGASLITALICTIGAYLTWKWMARRSYLRKLETARISPDDLMRRMVTGEKFVILDLRHTSEIDSDGSTLPGALRFAPEELEKRHREIPRDRDIVLYCT
jgi:membrane protein DedA with SNARE-associated domain